MSDDGSDGTDEGHRGDGGRGRGPGQGVGKGHDEHPGNPPGDGPGNEPGGADDATPGDGGDTDDVEGSVEAARAEVIDALGRSAEVYGFQRSSGRLYGVVLFADEPLSLDQVVERSGYAKSTVSTAMNTLERFHLITRRSVPGEGKKAFYEADDDLWHVLQQVMDTEGRHELQIMSHALAEAERELEAADDDRAESDLETVRNLQQMYDRSETIIDALTSHSLERLANAFARLKRGE